ncbi:hypothetical protein G6F56_002779 [Rhizopus delemar]|nr:hypothetical protein G6F56_002779 [Rhizopus delemar]
MLIALLCTLSIGLVPFLSQTEWIKIALTSIGCFGYAFFGYPVIAALVDTVVLRVLADQKDLYGRQKIGVPIGFASSVFLTGLLVETLDSLYALFIVFSFCNLAFVITIWFTNFDPQYAVIKDVQYGSVTPEEEEEEDKDSEEQQSILVLLQDPEAVKFFAYMATMGFSIAVVQAFLYLYMENELHAKPAWVGLLGPLGSIPEVICFYFSKQILHMLGAKYMLIAGQSILLYRCLTYIVCLRLSFGVWLAIATQLLHGIGFSMTWSAGALQADSIAPQGLKSRSQGLLNTAFNGIGAGLGALLGGYVYEHLGAEAMWTMVAIISFFSIVLYASSFATRFLFKPLSKLWSHTPRS